MTKTPYLSVPCRCERKRFNGTVQEQKAKIKLFYKNSFVYLFQETVTKKVTVIFYRIAFEIA